LQEVKKYDFEVASSGIMFIASFVEWFESWKVLTHSCMLREIS
jgi:hypothetical protein